MATNIPKKITGISTPVVKDPEGPLPQFNAQGVDLYLSEDTLARINNARPVGTGAPPSIMLSGRGPSFKDWVN